jgi:hypothetical protein
LKGAVSRFQGEATEQKESNRKRTAAVMMMRLTGLIKAQDEALKEAAGRAVTEEHGKVLPADLEWFILLAELSGGSGSRECDCLCLADQTSLIFITNQPIFKGGYKIMLIKKWEKRTWIKQNDKSKVEYWIKISSAIDVDQGSVLIIETNDNNVPQRYFFDEIDKERSKNMSILLTTSNQEKLIRLVEQWTVENNYKCTLQTCRLCLEEHDLIVSHIYPKWMIKHCRGGEEYKNKFGFIASKEVKVPPQDGPKELLLCSCCDQRIGDIEKYFKEFFVDKKDIEIHIIDNKIHEIKYYKYKEVKLFVLSLLWRLSVSSIEDFSIKIDIDDQEILRKMLLNEDAGVASDFPFYTTLVQIDGKDDSRIMMNPIIEKDRPIPNSVMIYISGILFLISKVKLNTGFSSNELLSERKWLCSVKSFFDIPILKKRFESTIGREKYSNS